MSTGTADGMGAPLARPSVPKRLGTILADLPWLVPSQRCTRKPEKQYAVIKRCSPGPYLELFAHRRRPGWAVWGNEINCEVAL